MGSLTAQATLAAPAAVLALAAAPAYSQSGAQVSIDPVGPQAVREGAVAEILVAVRGPPGAALFVEGPGFVSAGELEGPFAEVTAAPRPGDAGVYTVTLRAAAPPARGPPAEASFELTVTAANRNPTAPGGGAFSTISGAELVIPASALLDGASDPEGGELAVSYVRGAALSADHSSVSYTPGAGFTGTHRILYVVADPEGGFAVAEATVEVGPNLPPVLGPDSFETAEDVPLVVPAGDLLSNDRDPETGAAPSLVSASGAALSADGSTVTYTPPRNFHGAGGFSYTAADEHGIEATAEVAVSVSPVNDPPEARDLRVTVIEDLHRDVFLARSASDPDGDALSLSISSQPSHGSLSARGSSYRYAPDPDYNGPDSFTYSAADPGGLSDRGTVFITVTPRNDRPVLADRETEAMTTEATAVEIELRAHDVDGDRVKFVEILDPRHGETNLSTPLVGSGEAAVVTYIPDAGFQGTDRFTYRAEDEHGRRSAVSGSVTIMVTSADYVYVANSDRSRVDVYLGGERLGAIANYRNERSVGPFFDLTFTPDKEGKDDDDDRRLYVADFGADAIRRFDSSGSPMPRPGGSLGLLATPYGAPTAIAATTGNDGQDVLYVATLKGLEKIDTGSRFPSVEAVSFIPCRIDRDDSSYGQLMSPYGVAVCGNMVYVADRVLNKIVAFEEDDLDPIRVRSNPNNTPRSDNPQPHSEITTATLNTRTATGLTCDSEDHILYQSGERTSRVNKIDVQSRSLLEIFTSGLDHPYGLDEEGGTLYVADEGEERIAVFSRGAVMTFGEPELSDPQGVEVGPPYVSTASGQEGVDLGPGNDDPDFSVVDSDGLPVGANVTVSWGQSARLTVLASDPEGDPITIGIDSGTPPPGAVTVDDGGDGTAAVTIARPDGAEAALHVFYVTVTDGHSYPDYEPYLVIFED